MARACHRLTIHTRVSFRDGIIADSYKGKSQKTSHGILRLKIGISMALVDLLITQTWVGFQ